MPSIHAWKSIEKAAENGGYAGHPSAITLWDMSKREIIEVAIRLGAITQGEDAPEAGVQAALTEHAALKANGII